jgi:nucleoside-diphosphate-sugar epimerase
VFINTDSFFNTRTELPGAMNHYTLSKRVLRDSASRVAEQAGARFVNMQLEHVFGPADDATKFVPAMLDALRHRPSLDLTPGDQRRDFIYVGDVVTAFLTVIDRAASMSGSSVQIGVGTGSSVSIGDFVRRARAIAGSATELRFGALPHRVGEIMDSRADTAVLRQLGWSPAVSLDEGIRRTLGLSR